MARPPMFPAEEKVCIVQPGVATALLRVRDHQPISSRNSSSYFKDPKPHSRDPFCPGGGTWRLAGCRDYSSKYELGWHITLTANQHDAITAVEFALAEAEHLAGVPLHDLAPVDLVTAEIGPLVRS